MQAASDAETVYSIVFLSCQSDVFLFGLQMVLVREYGLAMARQAGSGQAWKLKQVRRQVSNCPTAQAFLSLCLFSSQMCIMSKLCFCEVKYTNEFLVNFEKRAQEQPSRYW